jgi:hypothetical protein
MTNEQIFELVGLNPDQIRAVAAGLPAPAAVHVTLPPNVQRPICKACGRPVGLRTCVPIGRPRGNVRTLNPHLA